MKKRMKIVSKILIFMAVIYGLAIYGGFTPMPFKVTDPSDPRFNINHFRFEDYLDGDDLEMVLNKMLPAGTDLIEIDRVLVEIGGAKKSPVDKISGHRTKYYDNPELYRTYRYFKISWVALFYQRIIPSPGRADRLVVVEVDLQNKSTFIVVYR